MKFVLDNIFLIAVAVISGSLLLRPTLQRRTAGAAGLNPLGVTRMINDRNAVVVDVREPAEFVAGHLPNARNIPLEQIEARAADLPSNKPIVTVCASGQRSGKATAALRKAGREDVYSLDGGVDAWRQAGLPLVK